MAQAIILQSIANLAGSQSYKDPIVTDIRKPLQLFVLFVLLGGLAQTNANDIVHDAEFYVLKAQHGGKWSTEDKQLDAKLAALRKKYGSPPNIVHIMWDDTPVGDVGIPALQQLRGVKTPNINDLAEEGINFLRMYTEPSCTPSRAAVITGRHPVRNGMYNVGFPYEYGGLADEEVTMAEVLGQAGYATAFFGKAHIGDIEQSYMTNQGFDEAVWTPYNQFPIIYGLAFDLRPGSSRNVTAKRPKAIAGLQRGPSGPEHSSGQLHAALQLGTTGCCSRCCCRLHSAASRTQWRHRPLRR